MHSRIVLAALAAVAFAAGCGQGGDSASPSSAGPAAARPGFPVTVTGANGEVDIAQRPRRIVSISPTATEMLFAIGAGDQVVAVDDQSTFPAGAPRTKLSGFQPNVEAIASYRPDLVVSSSDPGGLVRSLTALHIPVLVEPAAQRLADSYRQIADLGTATGHEPEAGKVVSSMRRGIASIVASVPRPAHPLSYYHELDDTYFSATSKTFIGQIYGLLGLRDIADGAKGAGSGYPQLSAEYIVAANPDLIFLADTKCCRETPARVAKRPGWGGIAAVRRHEVIGVDDDIASRWGPRVVDFLRIVARHVRSAEKAA